MERNRTRLFHLEKTYNDHLIQLPDPFRTDIKLVIKGTIQMPLKHRQPWGTNHLSRKPRRGTASFAHAPRYSSTALSGAMPATSNPLASSKHLQVSPDFSHMISFHKHLESVSGTFIPIAQTGPHVSSPGWEDQGQRPATVPSSRCCCNIQQNQLIPIPNLVAQKKSNPPLKISTKQTGWQLLKLPRAARYGVIAPSQPS